MSTQKTVQFFQPIPSILQIGPNGQLFSYKIAELLIDWLPRTERFKFWLWVKYKDAFSIMKYEFSYDNCWSVDEFRAVRQLQALFSKDKSLKLENVDPEFNGWEKFVAAEMACKSFNQMMVSRHYGRPLPSGLESLLFEIRNIIRNILGDEPPMIEELVTGFGPGANTTVKRKTSVRRKLNTPLCCSKESFPLASRLSRCEHLEFKRWFDIWGEIEVTEGELSFVPKDATILRPTIIESTFNTYMQKGVGRWLRLKLKDYSGIDLQDSQDLHQALARLGSITGLISTLDEVSASDMIACMLIFETFPPKWTDLLWSLRTGSVRYKAPNDEVINLELEKFSSMGNGYTFELESLLFYAISVASIVLWGEKTSFPEFRSRNDVRVYGDDIIVPTVNFSAVKRGIELCGFVVNNSKSFCTGHFRESCGGDFLFGNSIRPFYIRDALTPARLVGFYNYLVAGDAAYRDQLCASILELLQLLSTKHKTPVYWGAAGYGDGHLHTPDQTRWSHIFTGEANDEEQLVGYLSRASNYSLETNHFVTMVTRPKKDSSCSLRSDWIYYYFTLQLNADLKGLTPFQRSLSEQERFMRYLSSKQARGRDPYSMRGFDDEARVIVQQPGERAEIDVLPSLISALIPVIHRLY